MNRPLEWLFLLLVFSLAFMQPNLEFGGLNIQLTEPLFVLTAAVLAVLVILRCKRPVIDRSFLWFGLYFLAFAASTVLSLDVRSSGLKLLGTLYLIGLAVLTANVVCTRDTLKRVAYAWLIGSSIAALIGVITVLYFYVDRSSPWLDFFLHHYGSLPAGNYPRVQSTFIYPAMLCNYLTVGVLLSLAVVRSGRLKVGLLVIAIGLQLITALFTLTPGLGGVVLAICSWHGWELIRRRRIREGRLLILAGGIVAVLSIIVSAFSIWPISSSPYHFELGSWRIDPTQRMLAWSDALATFSNFPFFGKGIGLATASVFFQPPSGPPQLLTDAHNTWLNIAAQAGIFGLTSIIALTIFMTKRGLRSSFESNNRVTRALLIAFISAFVVQGFVGSFEDARHLWVLMGLIVAASRISLIDAES